MTDINIQNEDRQAWATFDVQAVVGSFSRGMAYPLGRRTILEHS